MSLCFRGHHSNLVCWRANLMVTFSQVLIKQYNSYVTGGGALLFVVIRMSSPQYADYSSLSSQHQ